MVHDLLRLYWAENGWELVYHTVRSGREKQLYGYMDLNLAVFTKRYLVESFPDGLFKHQIEGLKAYLHGKDLALTTGTASGKSAVFFAAAIDLLVRNTDAKVIAIYPQRPWPGSKNSVDRALQAAGLPESCVARLDGDVHTSQRQRLLRSASVLVATPDILHAWLVPNVGDNVVSKFISQLNLLIVDEVHVYTGVFGSNSAYLFRRLEHVNSLSGGSLRYITASATVRDPATHLKSLFGREFTIIDETNDTSEQHDLDLFMVNPDKSKDLLSVISKFLQRIASSSKDRFIVFVDSRKQTEHLATIISRTQQMSEEAEQLYDHLHRLDVLPYRAGFEEYDRAIIQERLTKGTLHGVISTSALELGIDIPHLDIGVLVGVPRSKTSLQQRIGRVGRQKPGVIVIINSGDIYSEAVFRKPEEVFNRPLAESALYLENPRIQYIHAMCLARADGEHDRISERLGFSAEGSFTTEVPWPAGFTELCSQERAGAVDTEFQNMKMEAGETPHHVYPLRDVESQFSIELVSGPERQRLGSLSYGQLMREAYPGAVYYYTTVPYRVYKVQPRSRNVKVRREKRYTTKPTMLPAQVFPNLTEENIFQAFYYGDLVLVEVNLQIRENVVGFKEKRGPNEINESYPLSAAGIYYNQPFFTRNYFTTGIIIYHPSLTNHGVNCEMLSQLIYECFLIDIPFERQDINYAAGKLKISWESLTEGKRFLALYDQTYGSLRLSSRLLEAGVVAKVFNKAKDLAGDGELFDLNNETLALLDAIVQSASLSPSKLNIRQKDPPPADGRVAVIMPNSKGLDRFNSNEEFFVEGIFFSPRDNEIRYRGRRPSQDPTLTITVPVSNIVPIPGESETGWYDPETGEIVS